MVLLGSMMNAWVDGDDLELLGCGGEHFEYDCHGDDNQCLYECGAFLSDDDDYDDDDDDGDILIEQQDDRHRQDRDLGLVIQPEPVALLVLHEQQQEDQQEDNDAEEEEEYYDAKEEEEEEEADEAEGKFGDDEESSPSAEVGYMIIEQATLGNAPENILNEAIDPQVILREKGRMKTIIQQRIADYQERQKKLEERKVQEQQCRRQELVKQFVECVQEVASPCEPAKQKTRTTPSIFSFQGNDNPHAKKRHG
jgi:hypothetical protein